MVIVMATNKIYTISNTRISRDVVLYNVPDNVLGSVLLIVSNRIEAKRIAAAAGGVCVFVRRGPVRPATESQIDWDIFFLCSEVCGG